MDYSHFSNVYDLFMYDQPYETWYEIVKPYVNEDQKLLDIGAGTGNFLQCFNENITLYGLDKSEAMVQKGQLKLPHVNWSTQDMTDFQIDTQFDVITCFCDSLNYLTDIESVHQAFIQMYHHLKFDGKLIFDMHAIQKFYQYFQNEVYVDELEEGMYIWKAISDEDHIVHHEMTFFIKDTDQKYVRFDEYHTQKVYFVDEIQQLLENIGFEIETIFADFDLNNTIDETSDYDMNEEIERIFFIATKSE